MKGDRLHPAVKFLETLYPPKNTSGYINLRFITPKGEVRRHVFISPLDVRKELPSLLKKCRDCNVFFQPALTDGQAGKAHILFILAVVFDVDFRGEFTYEKWTEFAPLPGGLKVSILVDSGSGRQGYFLLKEPLVVENIPKVEEIQKCLCPPLRADRGATDASHLLRLPGTLNFKYKPPREATVVRFKPELRYELSDFECLPSLEVSGGTGGDLRNPPSWDQEIFQEGVREGERNISLTKLAGKYVSKRLAQEEILSLLLVANSRFIPPLGQNEVEGILDSVIKTHRRNNPDFTREPRQEQRDSKGKPNLRLTTLTDVFNYPEPTYLIDPLLIEGTVTILGAYTGAGKSITALSIIKAVLTGIPLWNKFATNRSGSVLLIDEETPDSFLKDRIVRMGFSKDLPLHFLHFQSVRLDDEPLFEAVVGKIQEVQPVLVVIDSLIRIHRQREDDATAMALVVDRLRKIANSGATVLVIHHHRKAQGPLSQKLRGSTDIPGGVDVEYALVPKDDCLILTSVKTRTKPFGPVRLKLEVTDEAIEIKYLGTEAEELMGEIVDILGEDEMSIKEIYKELKDRDVEVGMNKLQNTLVQAVGRELDGERRGKGGKWYFKLSYFHDPIYTRETMEVPEKEPLGPQTFTEDSPKTGRGRGVSALDSQGSAEVSRVVKNRGCESLNGGKKSHEKSIPPHGVSELPRGSSDEVTKDDDEEINLAEIDISDLIEDDEIDPRGGRL